jgi:hypothetical protein
MPSPETAARGRALISERIKAAPGIVAAVPEIYEALLEAPAALPRCLVTRACAVNPLGLPQRAHS